MIHPLLAHAGAGATWQAAVVVAGVVLAVCGLLVAIGRLPMEGPGDVAIPFAAAALIASLGPVGSTWISDAIGWGLPLAVIATIALLLAALTPLELTPLSPLALGAVALAGVSVALLQTPLTVALHPPAEELPLADDSQVRIVQPADGTNVTSGPLEVVVEVAGGSIGPGFTPVEQLPDDPEEAGSLQVFVAGERQTVSWNEACTLDDPCQRVSFEVEVPPGDPEVVVEFVRGDGNPFAPLVVDRVSLQTQ